MRSIGNALHYTANLHAFAIEAGHILLQFKDSTKGDNSAFSLQETHFMTEGSHRSIK